MLFFPAEAYPTTRVRLTVLFGRELLGRGHAIDVVMQARDATIEPGPHNWYGRTAFIGPTDDRDGFMHRARKHLLALMHKLRRLFRARPDEYDAILVSDQYLLATIAVVFARMRGLKFIFWLTFAFHKAYVTLGREGIVRYPRLAVIRGNLARFFLHRWIVPLSDHVFVQSEHMAKDFRRHGCDPAKLTPVVTGIDVEEILPATRDCGELHRAPLTIAYLGTLARERRLELLVDMLGELMERGLHAKLLLVGDGEVPEDRRNLECRAEQRGVSGQIEITGFLPRWQALERIRQADICVSPIYPSPIFDGASPTKLVEYLALGLPVVANAHPDQSLVLRESRAGLCVPWGARHFARAILWLSRRSDQERMAFGRRGRVWAEQNRSYARIANDFEDACIRTVSTKRPDK